MRLDLTNIPTINTKVNYKTDTQILALLMQFTSTINEVLENLPFTESQILSQSLVRSILDNMEMRARDDGFINKFDIQRYEYLKRVLKDAGFDLDKEGITIEE